MKLPERANRRQLRLVDHGLQKLLLLALVLMESVVVSLAIWFLYRKLAASVDQNLYRIHFQASVDVLSLLVSEGVPVLGAMLAVNFLALIAADRIWAYYVRGILHHFDLQMEAARQLDFSVRYGGGFEHALLEQALHWREAEAARLARVHARIAALPAQLPEGGAERAALAARLAALQHE